MTDTLTRSAGALNSTNIWIYVPGVAPEVLEQGLFGVKCSCFVENIGVRPFGVKCSCFVENIDVLTLYAVSKWFEISVTCFHIYFMKQSSICNEESLTCVVWGKKQFSLIKKKVSLKVLITLH